MLVDIKLCDSERFDRYRTAALFYRIEIDGLHRDVEGRQHHRMPRLMQRRSKLIVWIPAHRLPRAAAAQAVRPGALWLVYG
jgi:hypothetical protein